MGVAVFWTLFRREWSYTGIRLENIISGQIPRYI